MCLDRSGQPLTVIPAGVFEARNPAGELFGFDRTAPIVTQPAKQIANAAQQFGQEDDNTVLTLTFALRRYCVHWLALLVPLFMGAISPRSMAA